MRSRWPQPRRRRASRHHGCFQQSEDPGGHGRQTDHRSRGNRRTDPFPRPIRPGIFQRSFVALVLAVLQRARGKRRAGRSWSACGFGGPVLDGRYYGCLSHGQIIFKERPVPEFDAGYGSKVAADAKKRAVENEDQIQSLVKFDSGAAGVIEASRDLCGPGFRRFLGGFGHGGNDL